MYDTPKDVSPFMVYNMVGNASEFLRGWTEVDGQMWRAAKGGEFKSLGYVWGIGSNQFLYGGQVTDKGVGFRCVREEKEPVSPP